MAHTPGPWAVDDTVALGAYGVWAGSWQVCSVLTESFLLTDGPENRAERDANAKLIAAAPDLLACLTEGPSLNTPDFLEWVAARLVAHGDEPTVDFVLSLKQRAEHMRAAIAKATN